MRLADLFALYTKSETIEEDLSASTQAGASCIDEAERIEPEPYDENDLPESVCDAVEGQPVLRTFPYVYRDEQDRRVYVHKHASGEVVYLASCRSLLDENKLPKDRVVIFYDELPHLRQADDEMKEAFLHAKRVFGPGVAIVESDNGPTPSLASGDTDR